MLSESDKNILNALCKYDTIREAANACGVSAGYIRERLRDPDFVKVYNCDRAERLQGSAHFFTNMVAEAADLITAVMLDPDIEITERIHAAELVLQYENVLNARLQAIEAAS